MTSFSAYDEPYLIALLNETIEVRSMQPSLLVQQIQIPGAQLICRSSTGVLYVLAGRQVFRVQSIPVDKQIKMLLEEKQFQLAVKLCVSIVTLSRAFPHLFVNLRSIKIICQILA